MKSSLPVLVIAALSVAVSGRADTRSVVSRAFGNTIVSTYPDGREAYTWLKANGGYTGEGRRHDMSKGHWKIAGDRLCFKQDHPFVFGAGFCVNVPGSGFQNGFTSKAFTGETTTVTMLKGHVTP